MSTPATEPSTSELEPILADLGLEAAALGTSAGESRCELAASSEDLERVGEQVGARGALLLAVTGSTEPHALADLRNRLWPRLHAVSIYRSVQGRLERESLSGRESIGPAPADVGTIVALRRREHVLSPEATTEKFDQNAAGWNGDPGGPGYPHFRWMRRLVGRFTGGHRARRILDFGCGAGWVGIEAALRSPGAELCSFDPSPEMVKIAEENARREGIERFTGRVGFGEAPPFPAEGEEPFDLVLSSGVVSFSPDFERWMEGLRRACAPGATLVVGDINPDSLGMRSRRRSKPLLPVRELNGCTRDQVHAWLEGRGFRHEASEGYQLSRPVPQLMHLNETRLGGALSWPLVWLNAGAAGLDRLTGAHAGGLFDSWVMRFEAPPA